MPAVLLWNIPLPQNDRVTEILVKKKSCLPGHKMTVNDDKIETWPWFIRNLMIAKHKCVDISSLIATLYYC